MAGYSFGQAQELRARIAQQGADTNAYNAQTTRMGMESAAALGQARLNALQQPPQPPQPTPQPLTFAGGAFGGLGQGQSMSAPLRASVRDYLANVQPMRFNQGTARVVDRQGSPTRDTVPAMLAKDEAVLNAGAAEMVGRKRIAELNQAGLKKMRGQPKTSIKSGVMHAAAGYAPEDEKRVYEALGMNPVDAMLPAVNFVGGLASGAARAVKTPIIGQAGAAEMRDSGKPRETVSNKGDRTQPVQASIATLGDGRYLQRQQREAEPQYYTPSIAQPSESVIASQGDALDAMSKRYFETPHGKRSVDLSNADFAAQGIGHITKSVDKKGNVTYSNVGVKNPYFNEAAQVRRADFAKDDQERVALAKLPKNEADLKLQAGIAEMQDTGKLRGIRDLALQGDEGALKQWAMLNPAKPQENKVVSVETPLMHKDAEGNEIPTEQMVKGVVMLAPDGRVLYDSRAQNNAPEKTITQDQLRRVAAKLGTSVEAELKRAQAEGYQLKG